MMYQISSIKFRLWTESTLEKAIAKACRMDEEYRPSYGTQLYNITGTLIWDSEGKR